MTYQIKKKKLCECFRDVCTELFTRGPDKYRRMLNAYSRPLMRETPRHGVNSWLMFRRVSWVSSAAGREREAATAEFGDLLLFPV